MNDFKSFKDFFLTSGIGWSIDFIIYTILYSILFFSYYFSNLASSICAVIFVFFVSIYKIFVGERKFVVIGLLVYLAFQLISISFYSYLINYTSIFLIDKINTTLIYIPIVVKILYTPFSLVTNFLFMQFLVKKVIVTK